MTVRPFVSVIICTRDRADSLARTLESMVVAATQVKDRWELLVVDNGSSDGTARTIESFGQRLPVRRVWQPVAGLSNARNAGVAASQGDYILWTDDDVVVDENWLAAWFRAFREHPDDAVFGGRAVPLYEEPHEPWFKANEEHLSGLLAVRDEPSWTEVTPAQQPFGLNYAVRGKDQRQHLYDPELGVAPGRRRGGEEHAVLCTILERGGSGKWIWDATVSHVIPLERQTARYIRAYYQAVGYDHPLLGLPKGVTHRARGLWYSIKQAAKAAALAFLLARKAKSDAVRWIVWQGRAIGSIRRYLALG